MYREYRPPSELANFVECFWRHERSEPDPGDSGVILPDGRVDVVWTGGGPTLVAGPQTRFLTRPLQAPFVAVGVRFHPGVVSSLLGLPAHELVDTHVPLADIDTRRAARLIDQLAALSDPGQAVGALGGAVAKLADDADVLDPLVRRATGLLDESETTVGGVASELALSERQLQRRFRDAVGYGPKTLQRILRFRRFVSELGRERDGAGGLARIAASTGYADQAHLTRESRQLSGLSPVQLGARWPSGS
jgi:AraC-like DNA-binding protein